MASLRGERFDIDLDQQDNNQGLEADVAPPAASAAFTFVGDIKERPVNGSEPPQAPSLKNTATGFPSHKDRITTSKFKSDKSKAPVDRPSILKNDEDLSPGSQPLSATAGPMEGNASFLEASEKQRIDAENKMKLSEMSPEEIARERQELFSGLSPALIEKLLKRSIIDDEAQSTFSAELEKKSSQSSQSPHQRRPSSGSIRKVSFAVEPEEEHKLTKRPTAERHSISASSIPSLSSFLSQDTEIPDEPQRSPTGHKRRPSPHTRKVSFAVPDSTSPQLEGDEPSATKHSISPSPRARSVSTSNSDIEDDTALPPPAQPLNPLDIIPPPVNPMDTLQPLAPNLPDIEATSKSVHWPQPPQPDLDPASETFLDDLHEKYFPNLSHDPSKLDWMKPSTESDSTYDPSAASIAPKDLRFDFNGALIPPSKAQSVPTNLGLHNHGDAPDAAGYTIPELARLARSAFPAQRCIAIQTLGRVLYRLGKGEFGDENDIDVVEPKSVGERAVMAKGLWDAIGEGRVLETLQQEAGKTQGHQTSIALAKEAVWNWRRGGGRVKKAV